MGCARRMTRFLIVLVCLVILGPLSSARAQILEFSPMSVDLSEEKTRATLSISNIGDAPVAIEARPAEIIETEGASYVDSDVLLVVPAIATIEPGEKQRLRIGFKGTTDLAREKSLVVLVSTVPPPLPETEDTQRAIAIRSTFVVPVVQ